MKPAFTLDFRNDAIALMHRTSGGWHQVGRVTFDDPDLPAALSYLRATALGLSPRGLSTKLILPDDQVLFTTVDAPGPDDALRSQQIRAALEGRTPYPVEDLVFDWAIQGGEVRVAVIARETLAEAEAFAAEHRFNPVSFAAAPSDSFAAEAWFGPSALAPSLLATGETVEREVDPQLAAQGSSFDAAEEHPVEPEVEVEDLAPLDEPQVFDELQVFDEPDAFDETELAHLADAVFEEALEPEAAIVDVPDSVSAFEAAPEFEPEPHQEPATEHEAEYEAAYPDEVNAFEPAAETTFIAAPAFVAEPAPEPRGTPIFGLADDEPTPSQAFASLSEGPSTTDERFVDLPPDLIAALQDTNLQGIVLEEAPMAVDVEDDGAQMADDASDTPAASAKITDLSLPTEAPPAPGFSPAMGFSSRRASAEDLRSQRQTPPPMRPVVDRPTAAKPLVAIAPKAERPPISRPTAAKPVAAKESKGLRGLGAFVSAPSLPGSRPKKPMISAQAPAHPTPAPASAAGAAAAPDKSLGRGLGARPPVRGKPRYLGLALTVLLLLVLAVIAAWSTSLAFRTDDAAEIQNAAATPAPDDEMLADGIDPEALADGVAAPEPVAEAVVEPEPAAEAAPTALASGQDTAPAPAVNPGATSGDEIFLASKDPAPAAPEPLDLPEVIAQGDPVPNAQAPPPPFGTVYQFDANGLIVPTPEGIVTPEGVLLVAGKPPVLPKARPEGLVQPLAALPVDPAAAVAPAGTEPALAPSELAPSALATGAAFPSDPALSKYRPKVRPAGLVAPAANPDDATLTPETTPGPESRLVSLRPLARPQAVLATGEATRAASGAAAASLTAQAEAKAAAEAAAAPASKLAVAISRKPQPRPRDLSRAVEAAVAAAVRLPEPTPEPEAEPQVASVQPKPKPKAEPEPTIIASPKPQKETGRDADPEADAEPELASVPVGKSQGSVAKQATFKNALNLSKTALIGVYGTPSNRYAMIRSESGRYKKVKVGDKIDGGKIQAITASEVRYQKGSKLLTLAMPRS